MLLPIDITFRIAGVQMEAAATPSFYKTSPGYTIAKGGSAPITTAGGVGGLATSSIGTVNTYNGGSGLAYSASGSGGGGSAGKAGAGVSATTIAGGTVIMDRVVQPIPRTSKVVVAVPAS